MMFDSVAMFSSETSPDTLPKKRSYIKPCIHGNEYGAFKGKDFFLKVNTLNFFTWKPSSLNESMNNSMECF